MERSFAQDVKQLGYGAGQVLTGEGILAITEAILRQGPEGEAAALHEARRRLGALGAGRRTEIPVAAVP